jgi:hypothetical protein
MFKEMTACSLVEIYRRVSNVLCHHRENFETPTQATGHIYDLHRSDAV